MVTKNLSNIYLFLASIIFAATFIWRPKTLLRLRLRLWLPLSVCKDKKLLIWKWFDLWVCIALNGYLHLPESTLKGDTKMCMYFRKQMNVYLILMYLKHGSTSSMTKPACSSSRTCKNLTPLSHMLPASNHQIANL